MRRERDAETNESLPKLRVRPAGRRGALALVAGGLLVIALVLGAAWLLGRWFSMGYPDSVWAYFGIGMLAAAPGIGHVARSERDVRAWTLFGITTMLALFAAEFLVGPSCPSSGTCAVVGVRGWLGLPGSIAVMTILGAASLLVGRFMYRRAVPRRVRHGRMTAAITIGGILSLSVAWGLPLAATLVAADVMLRSEPGMAKVARTEAMLDADCFSITDDEPELYARPNPDAELSLWSSYAVGLQDERRVTSTDGKRLPAPIWRAENVSPYEATVAIDKATGDPVIVSCRRISPAAGTATKADGTPLPADKIKSESPLNPPRPGSSSADLLKQPTTPPASPTKAKTKGQRTAQAKAQATAKSTDQAER